MTSGLPKVSRCRDTYVVGLIRGHPDAPGDEGYPRSRRVVPTGPSAVPPPVTPATLPKELGQSWVSFFGRPLFPEALSLLFPLPKSPSPTDHRFGRGTQGSVCTVSELRVLLGQAEMTSLTPSVCQMLLEIVTEVVNYFSSDNINNILLLFVV